MTAHRMFWLGLVAGLGTFFYEFGTLLQSVNNYETLLGPHEMGLMMVKVGVPVLVAVASAVGIMPPALLAKLGIGAAASEKEQV